MFGWQNNFRKAGKEFLVKFQCILLANLNGVRILRVVVVEQVGAGQRVDNDVAALDVQDSRVVLVQSRRKTI